MSLAAVTQLQGSLFCRETFTIQVIDDPGPGQQTSNLVVSAGDSFRSVNEFLRAWEAQILSDISVAYSMTVIRAGADKGKLRITSGGEDMTISWSFSGDATEATRWYGHLGDTTDVHAGVSSPFTLPNPHLAGFYPALGAQSARRASTGVRRGHGVRLGSSVTQLTLGSWTQHDTMMDDQGDVPIDVRLALDTRTDWSELFEFRAFVDDVFNGMGEPFSVIHLPESDLSADAFTGFFQASPIEIMAERVQEGWNDYLTLSFAMDGTEVAEV